LRERAGVRDFSLPGDARWQLADPVHEGGENAFGLADDFDLRQAVEDFLP
jgi:hypothetical protein